MAAAALQPLAAPGVAIFPDNIAKYPVSLLMKEEFLHDRCNVTVIGSATNGQPVFRIDTVAHSHPKRRDVIDSRSGQKLCTIRKTSGYNYYAEAHEGGPHLFDLVCHNSWKNEMQFRNAAAEDGRPVQIDLQGEEGTVYIGGVPVAVIERQHGHLRTEFHLHITAGLDMLTIVALTLAVDEKQHAEAAARQAAINARVAGANYYNNYGGGS